MRRVPVNLRVLVGLVMAVGGFYVVVQVEEALWALVAGLLVGNIGLLLVVWRATPTKK
jgi:hypothetical protein